MKKEEKKETSKLEKENKRLQVFVIIFMAIAICLGTFYFNVICFGAGCENKTPRPPIIINTNGKASNGEGKKTGEDENLSWSDYLLEQHILEAKMTRIRSVDLGDSEEINKTITLSISDLKEILSNLERNKLFKVWSEGRGGPERDHLTVAYEKNNQKYEFEIYYGDISVNKLDDDFKQILEKKSSEEKNIEYRDIPGAFYFYDIENFSETVFDKYFN